MRRVAPYGVTVFVPAPALDHSWQVAMVQVEENELLAADGAQ
ncbi:hypothetical protein [Stenotrophomonas sp. ATs4]